jgi:hypothetical protein
MVNQLVSLCMQILMKDQKRDKDREKEDAKRDEKMKEEEKKEAEKDIRRAELQTFSMPVLDSATDFPGWEDKLEKNLGSIRLGSMMMKMKNATTLAEADEAQKGATEVQKAYGRALIRSMRFGTAPATHYAAIDDPKTLPRIFLTMSREYGAMSIIAQNELYNKVLTEPYAAKIHKTPRDYAASRYDSLVKLSRVADPLIRAEDIDKCMQTIFLNKLGSDYEKVVLEYRTKNRSAWNWPDLLELIALSTEAATKTKKTEAHALTIAAASPSDSGNIAKELKTLRAMIANAKGWKGAGGKGWKASDSCTNCQRPGHTRGNCWRPGGGGHDAAAWKTKGDKARNGKGKGKGKDGVKKPFGKTKALKAAAAEGEQSE